MQTQQILALLALSANGALAANHRRHLHHHDKKALVYEATETVTDITWVTVTVGDGGETVGATSSSTVISPTAVPTSSTSLTTPSAAASTPSTSSSSVVVPSTTYSPTTLATSTKAASSAASSSAFDTPGVNVAESATSSSTTSTPVAATTEAPTTTSSSSSSTYVASSAAAATTAAAATGSSSSGNKRGAAYNTASLISPLIGDGTKLSWAYNWGSSSDGLSDVSSSLEYVPMLWGTGSDHTSSWSSNAQAAIDAGSSHLVSFNEPDNAGQSNLTPAEAATGHQTYMNPFSSKASIGAPAITNSNIAGESTDWLSEWIDACGGACDYDFCPAHWYNTIEAGADDLLSFAKSVYDTCGKPVWITEFEPTDGSDEEKSAFLTTVQDAFDSDEYSYVERYSYFMVADGNLVNGESASTFGSTFAYS